jgi:hypothetical protein
MSLAACIAVAVALLAALDRSDETFPTARTAVVVLDVPQDVHFERLLRDRAVRDHVDFFRVQADPARVGRRIVEPVIGDRAAFDRVFRDGRYRGGPAEQAVALRETHTSDRGVYFSTMSSAQAAAFVTELRRVGVDARAEAAGWWTTIVFTAGRPGVGLAVGASAVAVALLGRLRGVSAARCIGASEILGVPRLRRAETSRVVAGQAVVALCAAVGGSVLASACVGAQLPDVLAIAGCVYTVHAGLFLVMVTLGWRGDGPTRMRPGWGAWRPWGRVSVSSSVLRVAAVVSIALAVGPLVESVALLAEHHRAGAMQIGCVGCRTPLLSGTLRPDEIEAAAPAFARLYRTVDDGRSVLASHPVVPIDQSVAPDVGNTLVVNREYLRLVGEPFADPWPGRTTVEPGEWAVFVPTADVPRTETVTEMWREWFAFQREIDPTLAAPRAPVVHQYRPQPVFTFGAATDDAPLFADAPVVVVIPAASDLLSGDFLTAAASNGQFLLDVDDPQRLVASTGLAHVVGSLRSWPAETAAHRTSIIRTAAGEAGAASVAFVAVGMGVVVRVMALRWSDTQRVREATRLGIGPLRVHARLLLVEGVVVLVSVAAAPGVAHAAGSAPTPALTAALVVAGTTSIAVWTAVRKAGRDGGDGGC